MTRPRKLIGPETLEKTLWRERLGAYSREWYAKNRERRAGLVKAHYHRRRAEGWKQPVKQEQYLLYSARKRARDYEVPFDITSDFVYSLLVIGTCFYCDQPFEKGTLGKWRKSATLDRVDPKGGYTMDNTVAACGRCNTIKNDAYPHELSRIADRMEIFLKGKESR